MTNDTIVVPEDLELSPEALRAFLKRLDEVGPTDEELEEDDAAEKALAIMRGEKYNPNHEPAGSPEGGQFTTGGGGGGGDSGDEESGHANNLDANTLLDKGGEAQGMRDRLTSWFDEPVNPNSKPDFNAPNSAVPMVGHGMTYATANMLTRSNLKQEIVMALADRPGLADAMSGTLPGRFTEMPSDTWPGARDSADYHEGQAIMRQQGISVDGMFADQQGHAISEAGRVAVAGGKLGVNMVMGREQIQAFNARVFADANMDAWHGTSTDSDPRSHALQQAAVSLFGLKDADMGWKDTPFGKEAGTYGPGFEKRATELAAAHPAAHFEAYVREQYAHTQAELAKAGVTGKVMVYRGMSWRTLAEVPKELRPLLRNSNRGELRDKVTNAPVQVEQPGTYRAPPSARVRTQSNPLSSWSVGWSPALDFASNRSDRYHVVLKAVIDVKDIVSTARTGMGALTEGEVIVKGGYIDAVAVKTNPEGRF